MYGIELWGLSEAQWKELDKIQNRQVFCKKLMGITNCVACGFAWQKEQEKQVQRTDCKVLESDYMFGCKTFGKTMLQLAEE
jgi:Zn ribbon nucleic-acid-binding protein